MRPVRRGRSPKTGDYTDFHNAKPDLVSWIGSGWFDDCHLASYCSYCERKIDTNLAVEHIEPKDGPNGQPHLIGRWENFLLACVNCNSTKKDKQVILSDVFLPDRDNTFFAFTYLADGSIAPSRQLSLPDVAIAERTLSLVGLDKRLRETRDADGNSIALDRASQRMQAWGIAESFLEDYRCNQNNEAVIRSIVKNMILSGFFSVWMTIFSTHPEMRNRFIAAMKGTRESGCFDLTSTEPISPHPNQDNLESGGKI